MLGKYVTPDLEVVWLGDQDAVSTSGTLPTDDNELPIMPSQP